jgi:hypothetical protein
MFMEWPNRIWAASLDLNFFLSFLKLLVNMRLAISFTGVQVSKFLDLRIKSYGCLKNLGEVWARRACIGTNQQELTTCVKICGQEEEKNLELRAPAQERRATAGRQRALAVRPEVACQPQPC